MVYYGFRISDNLSTSPEGFLICHNVPIARTGYQDYLGSELPLGIQEEYNADPQKVYKVYRSIMPMPVYLSMHLFRIMP